LDFPLPPILMRSGAPNLSQRQLSGGWDPVYLESAASVVSHEFRRFRVRPAHRSACREHSQGAQRRGGARDGLPKGAPRGARRGAALRREPRGTRWCDGTRVTRHEVMMATIRPCRPI